MKINKETSIYYVTQKGWEGHSGFVTNHFLFIRALRPGGGKKNRMT